MKNPKKILIIVQRSNGDVFLSLSLINQLYEHYDYPQIDLLVNDDTLPVARILPHINCIHTFSYQKKKKQRWKQEKKIIQKIFRKYDLSINLTASDRSVLYALLASKYAIGCVEDNNRLAWWKNLLLKRSYNWDSNKHILLNNLQPLNCLKIKVSKKQPAPTINQTDTIAIKNRLEKHNIGKFLIFHPSAQYNYKLYSKNLRNDLLGLLNQLNIPIIVTGGNNEFDLAIKKTLPIFNNVVNWIGQTSINEYIALSELSQGYVGMDTLNMHIASAQNKRIFAIFGPTILTMWSPWSNELQLSATEDKPIQSYGNITIFQANMPCVACGKAGCDEKHGHSDCLDNISPKTIFSEIESWYANGRYKLEVPIVTHLENQIRKVLLFIVYGDDQGYYDGAKFSLLTFMNWILVDEPIKIVVLTEKPEEFNDYPIIVIPISSRQKKEWSLDGNYHFRIKNRGLAFVMDQLDLKEEDKILFFDTDTYFHKSPLQLFDLIQHNQALFYLNEGLIHKRKRFNVYVKNLEGKQIDLGGHSYELTKNSAMWGSPMIGIMPNMRSSLEWADKLMIKLFNEVPAHTIEPFSLSEMLLRKYKIVEGKKFVGLYSTKRKKQYAEQIISKFFSQYKLQPINKQIQLAQKVSIKRPPYIIIKQRLLGLLNK